MVYMNPVPDQGDSSTNTIPITAWGLLLLRSLCRLFVSNRLGLGLGLGSNRSLGGSSGFLGRLWSLRLLLLVFELGTVDVRVLECQLAYSMGLETHRSRRVWEGIPVGSIPAWS
jgi:hypothetical protein